MYKLLNWKDLGDIVSEKYGYKLQSELSDFVLVKRKDIECRNIKYSEVSDIFPKEGCIWVKVKSSKYEDLDIIKKEMGTLSEYLYENLGSKIIFMITNEDVSFEDMAEKLKEANIDV